MNRRLVNLDNKVHLIGYDLIWEKNGIEDWLYTKNGHKVTFS